MIEPGARARAQAQGPSLAPPDAIYEPLFQSSPDALLLVDAQGTVLRANAAAAALLGYPADELTGLAVERLVPGRVRERHAQYRAAYGAAPLSRPMGLRSDLVAVRRDGSETKVEIALSPIHHGGERFTLAAIRDVAAYPRVVQALRRAHYGEMAARVAQAVMDGTDAGMLVDSGCALVAQALEVEVCVVFLLEPQGELLRVAGGVGLLDGERVGDTMINRPDTPAGFVVAQAAAVVVSDYRSEQRFVVPESYRAAGLRSALALPLSDRGRIVGVLAVRARREMEFGDDELRFAQLTAGMLATSVLRHRTEAWLLHAQRLESLGQLTGGVAHDFNNLLTIILGNLQILDERTEEPGHAALHARVAAATRAARRGAELTARLLAFSRRQVLQPVRVDAGRLLRALAGMLRRTLDERMRLVVDAPESGPFCRADPAQLEGALLNLAINSRDAMPEGGALFFSARAVAHLPAEVAASGAASGAGPAALAGAYVELVVRDEGLGMSEEVRARAFEPFFTTKEAGRGTGLGLSTVYGFVQQSRGFIDLRSAPGQGATLTVYLPAWVGEGPSARPSVVEGARPSALRVLLVEDDAEVRQVVRAFFEGHARELHECASAEEALALLERDAAWDLLFSDIALGAGQRGTELADRVQRRWPRLPVLLMTGYAAESAAAEARWPTLAKPFERNAMLAAVAAVVETAVGATSSTGYRWVGSLPLSHASNDT